jgi:hypothetical protein
VTGQTMVFGAVLAEQMASQALVPDEEGFVELALDAGYDPELLKRRVRGLVRTWRAGRGYRP